MRGFQVTLSNGFTLLEEDLPAPGWNSLKRILINSKQKIKNLTLIFDSQKIEIPENNKVYFYKKRAKAYLNLNLLNSIEYGIGYSTDGKAATITWYNGEHAVEEIREVSKEDIGFIFNE